MKRLYSFSVLLTDEEFKNLKEVGKIFQTRDDYNIGIKIDPDDLIPAPLQNDLREFLARNLRTLDQLKPGIGLF